MPAPADLCVPSFDWVVCSLFELLSLLICDVVRCSLMFYNCIFQFMWLICSCSVSWFVMLYDVYCCFIIVFPSFCGWLVFLCYCFICVFMSFQLLWSVIDLRTFSFVCTLWRIFSCVWRMCLSDVIVLFHVCEFFTWLRR